MEKEIMKVYIAEVPYTVVIFGKSHPVKLELTFEYAESDDKKFRLVPKSLTGTNEDGFVVDYMFLVEEDSDTTAFIVDCVVGNKETWTEVIEEET